MWTPRKAATKLPCSAAFGGTHDCPSPSWAKPNWAPLPASSLALLATPLRFAALASPRTIEVVVLDPAPSGGWSHVCHVRVLR